MENDFKPVWYDDVDCASSETTFANCITRSPVGYGSCVTSSSSTSRADVRCGQLMCIIVSMCNYRRTGNFCTHEIFTFIVVGVHPRKYNS